MNPTLYYIMDPMCSWCYAFSQVLKAIETNLPQEMEMRYILGGLAPDSEEPMSPETQTYVQNTWRTITERTGVQFNFDFWTKCKPRRATYPACRAVIAAGLQAKPQRAVMVTAIQNGYYQQARNPSEPETLIELATEIGLEPERFGQDLGSAQVEELFQADLEFKNTLGIRGFPALVLKSDKYYGLSLGYAPAEVILQRLEAVIAGTVS